MGRGKIHLLEWLPLEENEGCFRERERGLETRQEALATDIGWLVG